MKYSFTLLSCVCHPIELSLVTSGGLNEVSGMRIFVSLLLIGNYFISYYFFLQKNSLYWKEYVLVINYWSLDLSKGNQLYMNVVHF
jgi:hypothetical protein